MSGQTVENYPQQLKQYYKDIKPTDFHNDGRIFEGIHKSTNTNIIIKEVRDFFRPWRAKRWLRQLFFWLDLLNHDAIVRLYYVHIIKNSIYVVFERMASDLHSAAQLLTDAHIRYITYEILRLLQYAHSGGVIFCDIRSTMFGLNEDCTVKLMELSEIIKQGESVVVDEPTLTDGAFNVWYRPPEYLLGMDKKDLTPACDMWALGCIIGQMLGKSPLFVGHSSYMHLGKIVEVLGLPTEQDLLDLNPSIEPQSLSGAPFIRNLKQIYPNAPEDAIDLLSKLLKWSPKKRITAEEALKHKFVAEYYGGSDIKYLQSSTLPFDEAQFSDQDYVLKTCQQFIAKLRIEYHEPLIKTAILAHNIARSARALESLPLEMWLLIFKFMDNFGNKIGPHEKIAAKVFNKYFNRSK